MKMQGYVICDSENMILSKFRTNVHYPGQATPVSDELYKLIPNDLYAGDEPRIRLPDPEIAIIEEVYLSAPGNDYDWDKETKTWKKRPEPVDEIAELKKRVEALEAERGVAK
jgi:hypothetical protein